MTNLTLIEISVLFIYLASFFFTFWIFLSRNGSTNVKKDEIKYKYSDRTNILVLESL